MGALNLALIMVVLILVGFLCRKTRIVDEKFGQSLSVFLFNIVFPAIIIHSMEIPFEAHEMKNSFILIGISVGTMLVMYLLGNAADFIGKNKDSMSGIMNFALMFPNFTFMAFPIMETLFPERGLFYISMYTIPTRILIYTLGPLIIQKGKRFEGGRSVLKNASKALVTPPVLAIPIGFAVYLLGIQLPFFLSETVHYISRTATPMGMILTGIVLAEASLGRVMKKKRLYFLAFLRLVFAPFLIGFILFFANLDPVIFKIAVIYSALPMASSTTVFALRYKSDPESAAGGVFLTTIISVITIPVCAYILDIMV